jgi:hypothetical protein
MVVRPRRLIGHADHRKSTIRKDVDGEFGWDECPIGKCRSLMSKTDP